MDEIPSPTLTAPPGAAPALWNPNAAASWSLLFSPMFGAYLQGCNARTLGRMDEAKAHAAWFYGTLLFLPVGIILPFVPGLHQIPVKHVGMGLLLAWYFSVGRSQGQYVKDTFGDDYPRKPWGPPLLVAFACLVGLLAVVFAATFVAVLFFGFHLQKS